VRTSVDVKDIKLTILNDLFKNTPRNTSMHNFQNCQNKIQAEIGTFMLDK